MSQAVPIKFTSDFSLCPEKSEAHELLDQFEQCNSDPIYKDLIDNILARYIKECHSPEGVHFRNVLVEFFLRINSRKNLRKYMYKKLSTRYIGNQLVLDCILDSFTEEIQQQLIDFKVFKIGQCLIILHFISSLTQNFTCNSKYSCVLEKAYPLYSSIMEVYTAQLFNANFSIDSCQGKSILEYEDCYTVLAMTLRQLASVLATAQFTGLSKHAVNMVILTHTILQWHTQLKFETISKCTIVLAHFFIFIPDDEKECLKYKEHPILDFFHHPEQNNCIVLKTKTLKNLFDTDPMKVVLNIAIYTSISPKKLKEIHIEDCSLFELLYNNLIELGMRVTSSDQLTLITKTLDTMTKYLVTMENYKEIYDRALVFSWRHLDHFLEQIVNNTKNFLKVMVEEAVHRFNVGDQQYIERLFSDLNRLSVFSTVRLNALSAISTILTPEIILKKCLHIPSHLLTLASTSKNRDVAGHAYTNIMMQHLKILNESDTIKMWLRPILLLLRQPHVKHYNVLENIVMQAFQKNPRIFAKFFQHPQSSQECCLILRCVHFARMHGLKLLNNANFWRFFLPKPLLEDFMVHQDEEVRLSTLKVLAECQKSTEEFTRWELEFLLKFFEYNAANSTKNKLWSWFKKIFTRFNVTSVTLMKIAVSFEQYKSRDKDELRRFNEANQTLEYYEEFWVKFLKLLVIFLAPDANFTRRALCMQLLLFLHAFSDEEEWRQLFQNDDIDNLKNILNDSYENNKVLAVSLLKTLPGHAIGLESEKSTSEYYDQCLKMACDIRPSQSVSASYMIQVLLQSDFLDSKTIPNHLTNRKECILLRILSQEIDRKFVQSHMNFMESVPLYGLLLSCRNLIRFRNLSEHNEVLSCIYSDLANYCLILQTYIMPIVCNTSPEGNLPESMEEIDESFLETDQSPKAQRILVSAWKTMKEIMLLLAEMTSQAISCENQCTLLNGKCLMKIGEFFMEIFVKSKHRGVFEQAHNAFTVICKSFLRSKKQELNSLPVKWLKEGVDLCTGAKTNDSLCATRRSAGLPFLILSIVPTLSDTTVTHLRHTVTSLLLVATGANSEARMHCLNVLRFLFKNSKLAEHMSEFIERGTIAALEGFRCKNWSVRNSSTLLLSSLISRIFGVRTNEEEETRMTLDVFYMRYKTLFNFLLQTLEEEYDKNDSLILHPVLLILARLYPSHNENINEQVKKHIPHINTCMRNSAFSTRDLAARASVSLISERNLISQLGENFDRIATLQNDNECHGLLLQICHILNTTNTENLPISEYLAKSIHLLTNKYRSHLTIGLYMDVVFMILCKFRWYEDAAVLRELIQIAYDLKQVKRSTCGSSFAYNRFQLLILLLLNTYSSKESFDIASKLILQALYGQDEEMRKKCLLFLIYLNQNLSQDPFKEHPLILGDDIEICSKIKVLVHALNPQTRKKLLVCLNPHLKVFFQQFPLNVLSLLLLSFYPFCLESLPKTIEGFLELCETCNEEQISVIISCLRTVILTNPAELKGYNFEKLIKLMMTSSAPNAADFNRLAVAQFLVGTKVLFDLYTDQEKYNVLNCIMVLLEDDELVVRDTMSEFAQKNVMAQKAREIIVKTYDFDNKISFLMSWALRRLPETSKDASEVYERGEMNNFAENIPLTRTMCHVLYDLLWKPSDLSIEKQTNLVTLEMITNFAKFPSPMVDDNTKNVVISVLKRIAKFSEKKNGDFASLFRVFFHTKLVKILQNRLDGDYVTAKAFFCYLYRHLLE